MQTDSLLRIAQVLEIVPVAESTWWHWVRTGNAPQPVRLGQRTTRWRRSDIFALIGKVNDPSTSNDSVACVTSIPPPKLGKSRKSATPRSATIIRSELGGVAK
jgi:prophage regulatory protein